MSPTDISSDADQKVVEAMETLMALQRIDDKLARLAEQKGVGPARLNRKEAELQDASELADREHDRVRETQKDYDKKEVDIKSCEEHIQRLEGQRLHVRKNEEYKALTQTIEHEQERCSRLEEEALVLLSQIDDHKALHAESERQRSRIGDELEALKDEVRADTERLDREFATVAKERDDTAHKVPPGFLDKYERIREGRGGSAVVAVVNGVCQGCSMGVTDQAINRLILRKETVFRENCSRMLYLPQDSIAELIREPRQG